MCQVPKTRKDEWWQFHGRSAAGVSIGCATVSGATGPKSSSSSCFARRRVSCHGHAHDWRESPRTTASPRRARECMLASWDLSSAQQTCRVCASAAMAPCSPPVATTAFQVATNTERREDIWWQRPTHDGRLHRVTSWRRSVLLGPSFWAKWERHSHTRGVLHSPAPACCGCVDQFAARGSRTSPAPDAWLRTHQNVRSRGFFTDSSAHDQDRQQTSWANDANSSSKSQKPEPRQDRLD